jgi:hypothetical protein
MPNPSTTSAQNINTELGQSTTTTVTLNETQVRNLACKSSGAISYGDCRWGINFPGGDYSNFTRTIQYATSAYMALSDFSLVAYDPPLSSASASVTVSVNSNGTLYIYCGSQTYTNTWLTSGSAGDYTVQLSKTSGDNPTGGDSINTDYALSTTRSWAWSVTVGPPGPGFSALSFDGNLIIKDSGGTLITRPFSANVSAEVSL